jgi:small multidrug resistance pump
MPYVYLLAAIVCEVVATSSLKSALGFTKLVPSIRVAVGYAASFYFLSLTLRTIPIGTAYAIWAGSGVALIAVVGWLHFGTKLDMPAVAGIALIVAGVVLINFVSDASVH